MKHENCVCRQMVLTQRKMYKLLLCRVSTVHILVDSSALRCKLLTCVAFREIDDHVDSAMVLSIPALASKEVSRDGMCTPVELCEIFVGNASYTMSS